MLRYIGSRLAQAAIIIVGITLAVFFILRVTAGDPAKIKAPLFADPAIVEQYAKDFGTDRPILDQLGTFAGGAVKGDLGESFRFQRPVMDLILEVLPDTMRLAALALLLGVTTALVLGVLGARYPRSPISWVGSGLVVVGQSAPVFWVGLLLILLFAVNLGWLPPGGYNGFTSLILPAAAVGLSMVPTQLRVIRASMEGALRQEYVRAARASGIRESRITFVYALRNASLPLLTVIGIDIGYLLGGVIVAEVVFNFPGLGQLALTALNARDFPLIQGITIVTAGIFVLVNLAIDLLYTVVDPRVRLQEA